MQNYIQEGEVLTLLAPRTVVSGEGALVGSIFGVATSDVTSGDEGEFQTEGVCELAKVSAQAWAVGDKIYWDNSAHLCSNVSTVGQLIGVATEVAANPTSVGRVKLLGNSPSTSEGPQAAEADLVDNSGGAAADGTIGVVTAPTALTDNGGGTADATVASMAASTAILVGTLGGTANGSFETVGATNGGDVSGAIMNNTQETLAFMASVVTWQGVVQNNFKELTTRQSENRAAIVALTDAVKELSTKINSMLAKERIAGIIAS
jgi:predicted RecA/RadA family phage recombinase